MSNLTNKSDINKAAADLLQKNSFYPAVVHCSYYSCIQLMKHILLFTLNKTENELQAEVRNSLNGSHEVIINNIMIHLRSNNKDWRTFSNNINQLKRLRVTADYENIQIDSTIGSDSINFADIVHKLLKNNVKI
jgi:hypothetical protein